MRDATLPLQVAVIGLLDSAPELLAIVPGGVVDPIQQSAKPPYLTVGGWQQLENGHECGDSAEVFFDVQAWSSLPQRDELAQLAGVISTALHRARPAVPGWGDVEIVYRDTQFFPEPGGGSRRAVIRFVAYLDADD